MSIENVKGSFTKKELFVIFSENHESTLFSSLVLSEGFSGKLENYFSSKNSLVDIFKFRLLLKILKFFRKVNDSYDHPDKSVPKLKLIESLIVKFIESSKNKNALVYLLSFYSSSVNFTRLYLENKNVLWLEDLSKFEIRKLYKSVFAKFAFSNIVAPFFKVPFGKFHNITLMNKGYRWFFVFNSIFYCCTD
jgi:hypothetical protein